MSFGAGKIYKTAFAKNKYAATVFEHIFFHVFFCHFFEFRKRSQISQIQFNIEVPRVCDNYSVFHQQEVFLSYHRRVAGCADKYLADFCRFNHIHNFKSVHCRLKGAERINLGYNNSRRHAASASGNTASAPAIASNNHHSPCPQNVCRAGNPING